MAAVYLTTMPKNNVYGTKKPNFYSISSPKNVEQSKSEDLTTFRYIFMKVVEVELWVSVPVAIFFPTVHYSLPFTTGANKGDE